jgi:hypothetical protein
MRLGELAADLFSREAHCDLRRVLNFATEERRV